jgi:putative phage-type endonuclease
MTDLKIKIKQKNYEGNLYNKKELRNLVPEIVNDTKIHTSDEVAQLLSQYTYYNKSEDKYYINFKRKQSSQNQPDFLALLKGEIPTDSEEEQQAKKEQQQQKDNKVNNLTLYGPFGSQWIHDEQVDDKLTESQLKMIQHFNKLRAIISPDQRTDNWHKMRSSKITASDGAQSIGQNKYDQQYGFILKKTVGSPFKSNEACYHGKKFEQVATMIYEYRMNVRVDAFGLLEHPKYSFLGASPDGICTPYKHDGKHLSRFVGRMLEIKCPLRRKILKEGEIIDNICPLYYWVQVQLQLECCELDECDFWQCDIREYNSREDFIKDTSTTDKFRSDTFNFEKGCLIQLMPRKKMKEIQSGKYDEIMHEESTFIYPPKIEMSPEECDIWLAETLSNLDKNDDYKDYYFDKIIYWRLEDSGCVTIKRDTKWFEEKLPEFKKMWDYVLFFREDKTRLDLLVQYINSLPKKINKDIMNVIENLVTNKQQDKYIKDLKTIIENNNIKKEKVIETVNNNLDDYMFVDDEKKEEEPKKVAKKFFYKPKVKAPPEDPGYMFVDDT